MNERIRALAEQADAYSDAMDIGGKNYIGLRDEYFAELIVRECSKVIVNGGYRNPAFGEKHQLTPPEIAKMIREHFGVAE